MKYLYVTWDAPHASYLESLFLPIFERLGAFGIRFDVLQFTWDIGERSAAAADACRRAGIGYRAVEVKRGWGGAGPFLSAYFGAGKIIQELRRSGADAVLARSTMPAIATMRAARKASFPFAFDADGLPLDERIEFSGRDPAGLEYRLLRDFEAQMVRRSAAILVRSAAARDMLWARGGAGVERAKFHIVTNGRDPAMFAPLAAEDRQLRRAELGLGDRPVLAYSGSLGGKYLFREMLLFFLAFKRKRQDAAFLILTPDRMIASAALAEPEFADIRSDCMLLTAAPAEVAGYVGIADAGLAAIAPTMSMMAAAPIKTAEYLLTGVPVAGSGEVGDTAPLIDEGVFRAVDFRDERSRADGAEWISDAVMADPDSFARRARRAGVDHFSLDRSAEQYRSALATLETRN